MAGGAPGRDEHDLPCSQNPALGSGWDNLGPLVGATPCANTRDSEAEGHESFCGLKSPQAVSFRLVTQNLVPSLSLGFLHVSVNAGF